MEDRVREPPPGAPDPLQDSLQAFLVASRDVGTLSLQLAERQLDAAICVTERVRDDMVAPSLRARVRGEGTVARLRSDAHRLVDVVADLGIYLLDQVAAAASRAVPLPVTEPSAAPTASALRDDITLIEGVGPKYAARLHAAGIRRCEDLLAAGATRNDRKELAEASGISAGRLLTWINHVDLFRIEGVGEEYASLLEAAGVDSVPELAQRNPQHLHEKLREVNAATGEVRRLPSLAQLEQWVDQAKMLPRVVFH